MRIDWLRTVRSTTLLLLLAAACCITGHFSPPAFAGEPAPNAAANEFFETHIRPVLVERCYECHSATAKVLQGGLRLDTAERLRAGGDSGRVVAPHDPKDSLLIAALRYESIEMPPSGKLPETVIDDFVKWVELGAPDPRADAAADTGSGPVPDPRKHWAFQQPNRSEPPAVAVEDAVRNEIDRFVVAALEAANLTPSPSAAPRVLLRRLYYDLSGLPPTADELDEFAADPTDARYVAAVDRLLDSPRFGERWGRYWLDVARYADTKGYVFTEDRNYKEAYRYRDWVIASFNGDRPFDQFVVAQLAADQIDDPACAPAIGFLTLGRRFLNDSHDIINDRIDVVTRGLMGLTVACARCHDHKYDPISAADYYALYSVFNNSREMDRKDAPPALEDVDNLRGQVVFLRGSPSNRGPKVDRHFLTCLSKNDKPQTFTRGSGRRELADAIASRDNPLTARVWVNRVWSHLFGHGLVSTPSDFGLRGEPPSNLPLLDWLACTLVDDGWSTKRLIRRIVLSNTYRQASDQRADCVAADPENKLLWHANRRRLDLEALRDSLLVAAGRLDETAGGPSVSLTDSPFTTRRAVYGFIERQNLPAFFRTFDFANPSTHTPERPQTVSPQQALFLMNSPFVIEQATHLAKRSAQTSPQRQQGKLANDEAAGTNAEVTELDSETSTHSPMATGDDESTRSRVTRSFRAALGRDPSDDELNDATNFVNTDDSANESKSNDQQLDSWEQLAQVLLMSNEFAFVD